MELACYDKLEDGTYAGEIPKLPGVAAFGRTLRECERELRSTVEDWVLVGLCGLVIRCRSSRAST